MITQFDSTAPFGEQADVTTKTNFFDTLDVCEVLFPLLRPHARYSCLQFAAVLFSVSVIPCLFYVSYKPFLTEADSRRVTPSYLSNTSL